MVRKIASYPKLTMWKLLTGSICKGSTNTVPGSKNLVNPSGTEARRIILRFCSTPSIWESSGDYINHPILLGLRSATVESVRLTPVRVLIRYAQKSRQITKSNNNQQKQQLINNTKISPTALNTKATIINCIKHKMNQSITNILNKAKNAN